MTDQSVDIDNLARVFLTMNRYREQLQVWCFFLATSSRIVSMPKLLVSLILIILKNIRQTMVIYNSFNIRHQADPRLRRLFLKRISKIERRDDMRFADKNSVQRSSKKTGSLEKKRDKVSATPLVLL